MDITTTKKNIKYVNCIIYGKSGVGKTRLSSTAPKPLILDSENGLLSIKDKDIPVIKIKDFDDLKEAYDYLTSKKAKKLYETIIIDSASEVAEIVLQQLKKETKDGRQAYMQLGEICLPLLRDFRDIPYHVIMICKCKAIETDGIEIYKPSMPGKALVENIPYLFDLMLAMRIYEDDESEKQMRYLQTQPSLTYEAKDRSGKLNDMEKPDLGKLFKKILK